MRIKNKFAEMSGIMAALMIGVFGLTLVSTVFLFANSAVLIRNKTGVNHSANTNVTQYAGATALIALVGIVFVIIIIFAMIKKVQE